MSVDVEPQAPTQPTTRSRYRRWGWILIAAAVWTFWVWITRVANIARLHETTTFKTVHYTLAAGSMAFGAASAWIGTRLIRRAR